jgi:hypothetical protein
MYSLKQLKLVFAKTNGHCHFCGDKLLFDRYGYKDAFGLCGSWEADHVVQRGKGGRKSAENCLPACIRCNRLRWHRSGSGLQQILFLGLISKNEIRKRSVIGKALQKFSAKRLAGNIKRRRKERR